jgi:energy-coupling factor transporter ATP-binding protein EcfA2
MVVSSADGRRVGGFAMVGCVIDRVDPAAVIELAERLDALARERDLDRPLPDGAARRARQLRDNLAGHVLPRARNIDAPLMVLLFGPTGAGKSSLLNALAGTRASPSGVLRPTTRELVAVSGVAPDRAAGSPSAFEAMAGAPVRLVESAEVPEGIALVDSPDVDSVEHANRELTDRLVEAADLGIFVTTASRYADRVPWDVLARARDRGLPLLVVLNRMPADAADETVVKDDLARLLAGAGIRTEDLPLVSIPEGAIEAAHDGLARSAVAPIRERIETLGADREARRALAVRALAGSLAGLAPLANRVADDIEHEAIDADALRRVAVNAFDVERAALREQLASGTFLRAEALRQWQAFVGADEITRFFASGIGKIRGTLSAILGRTPRAPVAEVREDALADILALARSHAGEAARRTAMAWSEEPSTQAIVAADPTLWSTSSGFDDALRSGLDGWISSIADDIQRTGGSKRLLARGASLGVNTAGIAVMLATFAHTGGLTGTELGVAAATGLLNQKLLEALFGEAAMVEMIGRARRRLGEAIDSAFHDELARHAGLVPEGHTLRDLAARLRSAAAEVSALPSSGAASDPDLGDERP